MTAVPNSAPALRAAAALLLLAAGTQTDALINGVDDFEHTAVADIMIYDPDPAFPSRLGWRAFCGGVLASHGAVRCWRRPCMSMS